MSKRVLTGVVMYGIILSILRTGQNVLGEAFMNHDDITNKNPKPPRTYGKIFFVGRKWELFLIDVFCFITVFFVLYGVDSVISDQESVFKTNIILYAAIMWIMPFIARLMSGAYSFVLRYANYQAYLRIVIADAAGGAAALLITWLAGCNPGFWQSISIIAVYCLATLSSRFIYQLFYRKENARETDKETPSHKIGVAIGGAGRVGALLADELTCNPKSHYTPICFIDRNNDKVGSIINGIPVYAEDRETIRRIKNLPIQEIFIALSNISKETAKLLYDMYSVTGCKVKLYDFPLIESGERSSDMAPGKRVIREFKIEDLLFRKSIDIDKTHMPEFYSGKTILVTGGGGSIGSELCHQLAKLSPKKLIILDIYENNAYNVQQDLIRKYGEKLDFCVEIASVRDRKWLECIYDTYRPDIVFHAAAHKHVPLMEHSACEAIKNNVFGTYNVADMAEKYGVSKFILISTDKAVNPTNVMGASKRMCEMIVQCRTDSKTSFAAVRFGNVLGSNGSVIPLFKKQIAAGGPVTITDKRIIRYFMTISEASQLVLEAGAKAFRGELFVLDMGAPVKILDLAENMIRISGFIPYVDIDIKEIGLRPGEKLYEELLIKTENLRETDNKLIFVEKDTSFSREAVDEKIDILREAVAAEENETEPDKIKAALKATVPTYRDPEEVNLEAEKSEEMHMAESEQKIVI